MEAAWISPDVVNNVILVLIGEQGAYKTTWFNYLLPPQLKHYFYTKTNANRMSKDDLLTLTQYALVCYEELDTMRPAELNQLKATVTMTSIDERAAYAHYHEHRKHIASFCGTGNNPQFLSDPTGNRRWLPFEVRNILSPYDHPIDYTGLYAQVMHLWQSGFPYWFNQEEIRSLAKHISHFEAPNMEEDQIRKHFRVPAPGESYEVYSVADVLSVINLEQKVVLSPTKVGMLLNKMGYKKVRTQKTRGYMMYRYTLDEISQNRKEKVDEGEEQELPF